MISERPVASSATSQVKPHTQFKVKVFDKQYTHFDAKNHLDRDFVQYLKEIGSALSAFTISCSEYSQV